MSESINPAIECPDFDVLYTEGDQLPSLAGCLLDVDLTGFAIRLDLHRPSDVLVKLATIADPTTGRFEFVWDAGDLQAGVGQIALVRITDPGGKSQSLARFKMNIREVPSL